VSLFHLIRRNLIGNAFRSLVIALCAALVASLVLVATFMVRGAEASLRTNLERLGADILVLPWGTMTEKIGGVRLMSAFIDGWMPRSDLGRVAAVDGVAQVSPQLYLTTMTDSPYSSRGEVYLVAFDFDTDFVVHPWLEDDRLGLVAGEAILGARVVLPEGADVLHLYGQNLEPAGWLEPTATTMDRTIFVNFETAERIVAWSQSLGPERLNIIPGSISAIMVSVDLHETPHQVSVRILELVRGVVPLETPGLFQSERRQMIGVLRTMLTLLGTIWALILLFMGLVFSIAANERRREIGVLRALGLTRDLVLKALLLEAAVLALAGGVAGAMLTALGVMLFGSDVVQISRIPIQLPTGSEMLSVSMLGQVLALCSVLLAAFIPTSRISRQDMTLTMRG